MVVFRRTLVTGTCLRLYIATALGLLLAIAAIAAPGLLSEQVISQVTQLYGERAGLRVRAWQQLQQPVPGESESDTLERVNRFFNQLHFVDDQQLWGAEDYWATPLEFLGANAGDCEDFSIAKYFTLLSLGVAPDKLRLNYVKALSLNQFHMVVTYYETPRAVPLVLDNIKGEILPASVRSDLIPVYSFNGQYLWLNKAKGQGQLVGSADRLKTWNDLSERYRLQALQVPPFNHWSD